ncbi:hypothetical protein GWD52_11410 [Enterobacteriaceae bacterium 4M9]|nr:hypothetical protein [Enterobacteriaceae bacterium 4M9]
MKPQESIPDVRDGLSDVERTVLYVLHKTQQEMACRAVPTAMLYGRVLEYINISETELVACLQRLGAGQ